MSRQLKKKKNKKTIQAGRERQEWTQSRREDSQRKNRKEERKEKANKNKESFKEEGEEGEQGSDPGVKWAQIFVNKWNWKARPVLHGHGGQDEEVQQGPG